MVGQGLAGSCLAMRLLTQGKRIIVFDDPQNNCSSTKAAGLFNPITGKLLTRTWMADKVFPELMHFYQSMEDWLGSRFFYPQPIYRPFISVEEQNEWMGLSVQMNMKNYIEQVFTTSTCGDQVHDPHGGILVKGGYLDVNSFIDSIRNHLISLQAYQLSVFEESELKIEESYVQYHQYKASKIILCTGTSILNYRSFGGVPIRPLKGETLTIQFGEQPELIFNRGVYVVPWGSRLFKVGATYEARNLSDTITQEGRLELEQKLIELMKISYQVEGQDWGFRPTTPDRRPILGYYPELKNVVIFNGLGTKGVSLAPYFSAQLANWLSGAGEIQPEVNISRFKSLFSKS